MALEAALFDFNGTMRSSCFRPTMTSSRRSRGFDELMATPPPVHVPRPYDRPEARLAFRVDVPLSDGALVATFVYCPDDTPDDAEWAFLPTPVLMSTTSGPSASVRAMQRRCC